MNTLEATVVLSKYVEDNFSTLPVYSDPTAEPDPANDPALAAGWVELHFYFGEKGPDGGRLGPSSTYYVHPGAVTCSIFTPRELGDGPARAAAVALELLLLELTIGDVSILGSRESMAPVEGTHLQLDQIFTFEVEAFYNLADRPFEAQPVSTNITERITLGSPHGLTVGQVVYRTSSGLALAIATAESTLAVGIVSAVHTVQTLDVTFRGIVQWTHGLGAAGTRAYLSTSSAGAAQTSEPGPGAWRQPIGRTWTTPDLFLFDPEPGQQL